MVFCSRDGVMRQKIMLNRLWWDAYAFQALSIQALSLVCMIKEVIIIIIIIIIPHAFQSFRGHARLAQAFDFTIFNAAITILVAFRGWHVAAPALRPYHALIVCRSLMYNRHQSVTLTFTSWEPVRHVIFTFSAVSHSKSYTTASALYTTFKFCLTFCLSHLRSVSEWLKISSALQEYISGCREKRTHTSQDSLS